MALIPWGLRHVQVPPFWGQDERQALIDAADLAGLKGARAHNMVYSPTRWP